MKQKVILLLAGLAMLGGCRHVRPILVPEISPPLIQEEVCSWEGRLAADTIFPCAGGIGWIDEAGKIIACDVEKKTVAEVFALPFAVTVPPFLQGDLLLLKDQASDRMLVYDLAAGGVKFEAQHMDMKKVLGVGPDGIVHLEGGRPVVQLWETPANAFRAQEADKEFFNCHFSPERILVLGRERLFIFWKKTRRFESVSLPRPAASPFLYDGENIYYGSVQRSMVKFPLPGGGAGWELKLGQVMKRPPLAFAGSIVASPSDQNVLQVNRHGTIIWWQALGSTMSFDLLPMSEHLAAVLLNHEVRFIDPKLRQVTSFKVVGRPVGAPLVFRGGLYFMTQDEKTYRLQHIGSRFGTDIELEPALVRWLDRSLRFTLRFYNLTDPSWECVILDSSGRQVFSKSMAVAGPVGAGRYGPVTLAWVPLLAGKYTIRVRAKSQGRDWESEAPVQVFDPLQIAPVFNFHF